MAFFLTIVAALSFSLMGALLARYYRAYDRRTIVTIRSLSLVITMLPALLLVDLSDYNFTFDQALGFFLLSTLAACATMTWAFLYYFLPVAYSATFARTSTTICVLTFASFMLNEPVSGLQKTLIAIVIGMILILSVIRHSQSKSAEVPAVAGTFNFKLGLLVAIIHGLLFGYFITKLTAIVRETNPFLIAYWWEASTAVVLLLLAVLLKVCRGKPLLEPVPAGVALRVSAISALTLVGTCSVLNAYASGNLNIVATVLNSAILFSIVWGRLLYGEKITREQFYCFALIFCSLVALKLYS